MTTQIGLALPVTGTFALPLAAYFSVLSFRGVQQRLADEHYLGDNSSAKGDAGAAGGATDNKLFRATRSHQNFAENVPLALVLAAVAEANGGSRRAIAGALGALFALRLLHAEFGIRAADGLGFGRPVGYFGTLGVQLGLAGYAAYLAKAYWGF